MKQRVEMAEILFIYVFIVKEAIIIIMDNNSANAVEVHIGWKGTPTTSRSDEKPLFLSPRRGWTTRYAVQTGS